jgi:ketosteroid isomerase-like protein
MAESNVEMARRGYQAVVRGDLDVIWSMLAPDVKWHGGDPSDPTACHSRGEVLEVMRQAFGRGGIGELIEIVDAGDKVVVIMRPPAQDGEPVELVANLTTFRDGKVVEMIHFPDPDEALLAADV